MESTFIEHYVGMRARAQRLSDYRIVGGWIEHFEAPHIGLRMPLPSDLTHGEGFFIELHGRKSRLSATFTYRAADQDQAVEREMRSKLGSPMFCAVGDQAFLFKTSSPIRHLEVTEPFRLITQAIPAILKFRSESILCEVNDIGDLGVGLVCDAEVPLSTNVTIDVNSEVGIIRLRGEVRTCLPAPLFGKEIVRIGLRTAPADEAEAMKWMQLLDTTAAKYVPNPDQVRDAA